MTLVTVSHNPDKLIFEFEGHTGYADKGEDIVCAGVSSIALLCANVCKELGGDMEMEEGHAKFIMNESIIAERFSGVLLDTLFLMAMEYKENLDVKELYNED